MTEYLLGKIEDFPEGKGRAFRAGSRTVAVFRTKDKIFLVRAPNMVVTGELATQ